jgi:predicted dehydrogenase
LRKVKWGVIGVAKIATEKVIPAMQRGKVSEIAAIASRDPSKARTAAEKLGIPRSYGSYEELLADPEIEAIYNPLPNQLHVPWSIKAAEAGKHVLCEKPLSLTVAEAKSLLAAQERTGVIIAEGFMVRGHPQWLRVRELIAAGRIGDLRSIQGVFSYFNTNPANIRNVPEHGGGSLMDIGCYPIHTSRWMFGEEPVRVMGLLEQDPEWKVDRLTSAMLEFPSGQAIFSCSMQLVYHQRMQLLGTRGRIEMRDALHSAPGPCQLHFDRRRARSCREWHLHRDFPTLQPVHNSGEAFSRVVREGGSVPVPLTDAIKNMAVIEAIVRSGRSGRWEVP